MSDRPEEAAVERVMGIFAHPDDPEFFSGGTFAKWAAEGKTVTFVLATSGDKGSGVLEMQSDRLVEIREAEERAAAARLGVHEVVFLRYPDGELQPSLDLRRQLTRLIRIKQPDIVVTNDPTAWWYGSNYINHPDHRAIGEAALAAIFPSARDHLTFPELYFEEHLAPHKVRYVYVCGTHEPNLKVDVTDYLETKIAALYEHRSQIADMEEMARRQRENVDPQFMGNGRRYTEAFRFFQLS
ncbi:MAG: PIG-L family deacetylase [Chloroflexi bacterium]|jgi:LmbE family N-acetylglucosaminyl deacetylase|nr:PIG-L family deacetylase [Chloroflexota bacterium]